MSVSQFILAINWIAERKFKEKYARIKQEKSVLIFLLLYLVHVLALAYTSWPEGFIGRGYNGLDDLRIKLPLLLIPIIIGSSQRLNRRQIKTILMWFGAAVFASTLISTGVLLGFTDRVIHDVREISLFLSHIRFSLLINIVIFSIGYELLKNYRILHKIEKIVYPIVLVWLIIFLVLLQSLTGLTVLTLCSSVFIGVWAWKQKSILLKTSLLIVLIGIPILIGVYMVKLVADFRNFDKIKVTELPKHTQEGNRYEHLVSFKQVENKHWVGLYICNEELEREWNKVSSFAFTGKDEKEQLIRYTIYRYLTSLNLRKDASGIASLSNEDIRAIEKGIPNYIFNDRYSLYPRIYLTIWEVDLYSRGGNPTGQSVSQRIEYLKAGFAIIKDNKWFGVGTGDVQLAFREQYEKMSTQLSLHKRLRAHNQFVTFIIGFGFIGFAIILFALVYPIFKERKHKSFLFMLIFIIAIISMLNEDTLETQPGVTFFAFFYCLFIWAPERLEQNSSSKD